MWRIDFTTWEPYVAHLQSKLDSMPSELTSNRYRLQEKIEFLETGQITQDDIHAHNFAVRVDGELIPAIDLGLAGLAELWTNQAMAFQGITNTTPVNTVPSTPPMGTSSNSGIALSPLVIILIGFLLLGGF